MKRKFGIVIILLIVYLVLSTKGFDNIIDYNYDDVKIIKWRDPGDGRLYVTEDEELIDKFISMMEHSKYLRFIDINTVVGSSSYSLFTDDDDNSEIIRVNFLGKNRVQINKKQYIILKDNINERIIFFDLFYTEDNLFHEN
jgi:hypothetical protein